MRDAITSEKTPTWTLLLPGNYYGSSGSISVLLQGHVQAEQVLGILNEITQKQLILIKYILQYSLSWLAHPTTTSSKESRQACFVKGSLYEHASAMPQSPAGFGWRPGTEHPRQGPEGGPGQALSGGVLKATDHYAHGELCRGKPNNSSCVGTYGVKKNPGTPFRNTSLARNAEIALQI